MQNFIYAYGNSEYLFYVFDGVARILKPENTQNLIKLVSLIGLSYIVGKNIFEGRDASSLRTQFTWVFKYIVMTGALMLPVGSVIIKDVVTHIERKVDNLPVGLTVFAGIFNSLGYAITSEFEKNFTPVNYLPYHQYGLVFGSQMVAETRNLKIEDPIYWENMYNFIDRCVIDDVMIGTKYNIQDLKTTNNIWKLISENASTFFSFDFRNFSSGGQGSREIVTCRVGAERLSKEWNRVYNTSLKSLTSGLLGVSGKKNAGNDTQFQTSPSNNAAILNVLQNNIQGGLNFLGSTTTAQDYLRQQMMINAIQNGPAGIKGARGASTQVATWVTAGEIARQSIPIMKGVIEAIVYSSFIFVYFMMMLPNGWAIFTRYLGILFWLQLWAPLYAVLNMMMSLFAYSMTAAEFTSGINMANLNTVSNIHQGISAMSGYFSASIPFIAKVIIDSSSHGLVQLASSVTGSLQSTAGMIAGEALNNNLSLDNTSIGNLQYANSNLLKSDYGSSYKGSSSEWQMASGSLERIQSSGELMTMSGQGLTASSGHTRLNVNEMLGANWSKSLSENASETEALAFETSKSEQNHFTQSASMLAQYAERASVGENKELSKTSQYAESASKTVDFIKNLQERHGFTHQQAAEAALNFSASLSAGVGVPKVASIKTMPVSGEANASIGLSGNFNNSKTNDQNVQRVEELAKKYNYNESYENVIRGMTSKQFSESKHIDKMLSEDFSENYQEMRFKQESLQNRIETGRQYSEALSQLKNGGISYDHDGYDDMQQWLMNHKGMNQYQAARVIDSGGQEFKQYFNEFANEVAGTNKLLSDAERIKNNINFEKTQKAKQELSNIEINMDVKSNVENHAANMGMNTNVKSLDSSDINNQIADLNKKANDKYTDTKTKTQLIEIQKENEFDKLEDGRLINKLDKPWIPKAIRNLAPGRPKMNKDSFDD